MYYVRWMKTPDETSVMGETNMGRYRNPRYAPEFLERKLSPTAFVAPAPMVFVPTAAPDPADTADDGSDAAAADSSPDDPSSAASGASFSFDGGSGSPDDGSGSGSCARSTSGDGDGWGPDGEPPFVAFAYEPAGPAVAY
jgi:hypothetical protein